MAPPRLNQRRKTATAAIAGSLHSSTATSSLRLVCFCMLGALLFVVMNLRQQPGAAAGYIDGTLLRVTSGVLENNHEIPPVAVDASVTTGGGVRASTTTTAAAMASAYSSMKEWRDATTKQCSAFVSTITNFNGASEVAKKEELEKSFIGKLTLSTNPSNKLPADIQQQPYARCKNTFIDLGTNIGDSVGYFIDNAIDTCSPLWASRHPKTKFNADFPRPHLDVTSLEIQHRGNKGNPLFGLLQGQAKDTPSESFCVYGMEGNPAFTERLTRLENYVRDMRPRPVRHVHIFTESVVTAKDGPTKLYLDKTSVEQNFWGSSILSSQQDAVKSAKELNNGQVFSADVTGISLSTMVKKTMLAFSESATDADKRGGLLIIKMDVEGAEYQVLKEVAESGVLCDYAKMGNRVVFVVEYHNMSITDPLERQREKKGHQEAIKKMEECGVDFQKLHAFWA